MTSYCVCVCVHVYTLKLLYYKNSGSWGTKSATCSMAAQEGIPWSVDRPAVFPARCKTAWHHQWDARSCSFICWFWNNCWASGCSGKQLWSCHLSIGSKFSIMLLEKKWGHKRYEQSKLTISGNDYRMWWCLSSHIKACIGYIWIIWSLEALRRKGK